jgi:hypothetical protein
MPSMGWRPKGLWLLIVCVRVLAGAEINGSLESFLLGTRDPLSQEKLSFAFTRLRLKSYQEQDSRQFFRLILDLENWLGRSYLRSPSFHISNSRRPTLPFDPVLFESGGRFAHSRLSLYRAYSGLRFKNSTLTIGLQRIALGVGRIWTPVDVFHPLDSFSLETGERPGIAAINFEFFPSSLSKAQAWLTLGQGGELNSLGMHYKSFLSGIDAGITLLSSSNFDLLGLEAETNLGKTGIEIRTELAIFEDRDGRHDLRGILGADYGFPGEAILALEFYYNGSGEHHPRDYNLPSRGLPVSLKGRQYFGSSLIYPLHTHLNLNLLAIQNLGDQSRFFSTSLGFRLDDNQDLSFGILGYAGSLLSEYGSFHNTVFFNYSRFF